MYIVPTVIPYMVEKFGSTQLVDLLPKIFDGDKIIGCFVRQISYDKKLLADCNW